MVHLVPWLSISQTYQRMVFYEPVIMTYSHYLFAWIRDSEKVVYLGMISAFITSLTLTFRMVKSQFLEEVQSLPSGSAYNSNQYSLKINDFHISNFIRPNAQPFVECTFELQVYLYRLHVLGYYLHTKHGGDAGRRIHEVPCSRPSSPCTK